MKITTAELWDEVVKVAAENPDYVYENKGTGLGPSCAYVADGKPSCIVGHALYRLGVPIETVADFDNYGVFEYVVDNRSDLIDASNDSTYRAVAMAQTMQDEKHPWGASVAEAAKELAK